LWFSAFFLSFWVDQEIQELVMGVPNGSFYFQRKRVVQDYQNGYSFYLELSLLALELGRFLEGRTRFCFSPSFLVSCLFNLGSLINSQYLSVCLVIALMFSLTCFW
jgi:hypothetical protein